MSELCSGECYIFDESINQRALDAPARISRRKTRAKEKKEKKKKKTKRSGHVRDRNVEFRMKKYNTSIARSRSCPRDGQRILLRFGIVSNVSRERSLNINTLGEFYGGLQKYSYATLQGNSSNL